MKDNRTDELQVTANAAEAEKEEEVAAGLKKFKDVQALVDAYQALEAEFTRRSQRLKELEASKEEEAPELSENAGTPSQRAVKSTDGEKAPLTVEEKNAVIAEYLSGVCANKSVPFVMGGGAVKAAKASPTTLGEAGMLAKNFFDNKED